VKIEFKKTIEAFQHRQDEAGTKLPKLKTFGAEADLKTCAEKGLGRRQGSLPPHSLKVQMSNTTGHAAHSHSRRLAEAIILQSIEDLWNPVCKRGSLMFFEGDGFAFCSELAGISYIKQLAMLRMLGAAGSNTSLRNRRNVL